MKLFLNLDRSVQGGPQVWGQRFQDLLGRRGYTVTSDLGAEWEAALFINRSEGLDQALIRGKPVGYRVANGYLPGWFRVMNRPMKIEHHTANANIARALEIAGFVIYQSQWAKDELDAFLYHRTDGFAIIPNGVDLSLFHPPAHFHTGVPVIGTVGVLRYRYRLETILEMSRRLASPHQLLVVGSTDAECAEVLHQAQADPIIGPRLTYQKYVPPHLLPAFYQQMNLLVHPVCGDVCPNVVVEAQACGIPVVAPRYGGASELIGEAGVVFDCQPWVYDDDFIDAMTVAAQQALANTDHLSVLARHNAEERFDLQTMTDCYLHSLGFPLFQNSVAQTYPFKSTPHTPTFRQQAARLIARPRYYAALTLRKARQIQRKILAPRPNPRPRIAFTLFDFHVGGIENWLYRLACELRGQFDFYFLATKVPDFLPKFKQVGTCAYLPNPAKMISYLQKHNIDLLQAHNERWPIDAALAAGVLYVIERTDGTRSCTRVPKNGLSLVIASSRGTVPLIARQFPVERIRVIYNGIDLNEVDSTQMERPWGSEFIVVGRASRFGQGKNLGLLIEAMQRLAPDFPQIKLVIIGGDSLMPGAKSLEAELKVMAAPMGTAIEFLGIKENALPWIKGFDIGTCVSNPDNEGIPNSLIEVMACGKPVVSTNVDQINELVQHEINGLLVPPGNLEALCAAFIRLINNPVERQRLGEAGRRTVEEKFSLQQAATQYSEIYHRLLQGE
jgi:glycosyltransferase involved in cell wall biosynthesis